MKQKGNRQKTERKQKGKQKETEKNKKKGKESKVKERKENKPGDNPIFNAASFGSPIQAQDAH